MKIKHYLFLLLSFLIGFQANSQIAANYEVGTWKDYIGKELNSKRKYKDSICYTTEYHKNGKIRAVGISKMISDSATIHWFLSGEWKFYDNDGVLLGTKIYKKGEPILETYHE